jgi:hypothetical protein
VWSVVVRRKSDRVLREYTDEAGRTVKVEVQGLSRFVTTPDGISYHFVLTKDPRWGEDVRRSVLANRQTDRFIPPLEVISGNSSLYEETGWI